MRLYSVHLRVLLAAAVSCTLACESRAVPKAMAVASPIAVSLAVERMRAHFATAQGFSVDSLNARADWFTDSLLVLLRQDMGDGTELGVLNWDPFTSSQDSASGFARADAHVAGDTTYVAFVIVPAGGATTRSTDTVTLAMHFEHGAWRIADFRSSTGSVADRIARSLAPTP